MTAQSPPTTDYSWLHDDEEEDLVGSDWHQDAIVSLYDSLTDLARREVWPWHVGNQLTLAAVKPDGSRWRPCPDIMVYAAAGAAKRKEMSLRTDGPPTLVVEVASETTWQYDVDAARGKMAGYLHIGVAYYLVFDPTGQLLPAPCQGWRRQGDVARAWAPEVGRYACKALGIALAPDGERLRVHDPAGNPMPYNYEKSYLLVEQAKALAAERAEKEAHAREITALQAELARLREHHGG